MSKNTGKKQIQEMSDHIEMQLLCTHTKAVHSILNTMEQKEDLSLFPTMLTQLKCLQVAGKGHIPRDPWGPKHNCSSHIHRQHTLTSLHSIRFSGGGYVYCPCHQYAQPCLSLYGSLPPCKWSMKMKKNVNKSLKWLTSQRLNYKKTPL